MALRIGLVLSLLLVACVQASEEELISPSVSHRLGAPFSMDPQSPEVQESARKAVEVFNSKSGYKKLFRLLDVTSAEAQVTNLITYRMQATIGKTKCPKSTDADVESCLLHKKHLSCAFEVTFDPRTNRHEVVHSKCRK